MKFGLALPHYDFSPANKSGFEHIASISGLAEAGGFSSLWISDHLTLDLAKYGGSAAPAKGYEWSTTLGALAVLTESIRLGTLVLCTPLRSPAVTARAANSIDQISGGRFELGLGAGWYPPDFELAEIEYRKPAERIDEFAETATEIRRLMARESDIHISVAPVQSPHAPVTIGGKGGNRLLRAVALAGDKWNVAWAAPPAKYAEALSRLAEACNDIGRDSSGVILTVGLTTLVGRTDRDLRTRLDKFGDAVQIPPPDLGELQSERLAGTPDQVQERVADYAALGVDEIICNFGPVPFTIANIDDVEVFAEAVIRG